MSAFEEGMARKVLIPSLFGYVKKTIGTGDSTSTKWTSERFFTEIQKLGKPEIIKQINNLFEFSRKYSDDLSWGRGTQTGSFTFRKKVLGAMISIFSVETNGHIYIRLDYIKQKVTSEVFRALISEINSLPEIKISDVDQYPYLNPILTKDEYLNKFEDIILRLLEQAKQE